MPAVPGDKGVGLFIIRGGMVHLLTDLNVVSLVGAVREPPLQAPSQWNRQVQP